MKYNNCSVCRTVANALADVTDDLVIAISMSTEVLRIDLVIVSLPIRWKFDSKISIFPEDSVIVAFVEFIALEAELRSGVMNDILAGTVTDVAPGIGADVSAGPDANE